MTSYICVDCGASHDTGDDLCRQCQIKSRAARVDTSDAVSVLYSTREDSAVREALKQAKYSHYVKPFPWSKIDIYRLCGVYGVTDACLAHAVKKLLVAGKRGSKDMATDVQEAIDTLKRWQEMQDEDASA